MKREYDFIGVLSFLMAAFLTANAIYDVFHAESDFLKIISAIWIVLLATAVMPYFLNDRS